MISTALILAGGKGERMMPLTELQPKALVPINGVPILKLQINQLLKNGVSKIYVLVGYLGEQIQDYVKNLNLGEKVICIHSDPNFTPGKRLVNSLNLVTGNYILLYCDNFIPNDEIIRKQLNADKGITLLLHKRESGNIRIKNNLTAVYECNARKSENPYVELGFIAVRSAEFNNLLINTESINQALEKFTQSNITYFNILTEKYQSLSDFSIYLEQNLQGKIIILDRDGIINTGMESRKYLTSFDMLHYEENNLKILSMLASKGYNFIVATNQPGVSIGDVSETFLSELHQLISQDLRKRGINILCFYVCKHHWNDLCECRKPKPGMLNKAILDFKLNREDLVFIGDQDTDVTAASASRITGIKFTPNNYDSNLSLVSTLIK